jgi:hypothetical protein
MPRIEMFQQRTSPNVGANLAKVDPGIAEIAGRGGEALARAGREIAQDALTIRELDQRQEDEKGAVWANEQAMANRSEWTTKLPQMMDEAPEDGTDFSKNVLSDFDESTSKILENAPNPRARTRLQQTLQQQRLVLQEQSQQFQREQGVKFKLKGTERALDSAMISARARPEDFESLATEHDAAVQSAGFTPKVSADVREKSYRALAGAAVEGLIQRDPHKTLAELNSETPATASIRALNFDQRDHLRMKAEQEIRERDADAKRQQSELKQSLSDKVRDATTSYRMGLDYDQPPTRMDFVAALGSEDGNKEYANFTKEQQLGADLKGLAMMPPEEQQQLIESRAPKGTEGAAEDAQRYHVLTQQAKFLNEQREKDPAAYVVQYSPAVQRAFAAAPSSPEAAQQYALTSLAEQKRLGVTQPQVLPEGAASTIAQKFYAGNGEDTAALVATEQQKWGPLLAAGIRRTGCQEAATRSARHWPGHGAGRRRAPCQRLHNQAHGAKARRRCAAFGCESKNQRAHERLHEFARWRDRCREHVLRHARCGRAARVHLPTAGQEFEGGHAAGLQRGARRSLRLSYDQRAHGAGAGRSGF